MSFCDAAFDHCTDIHLLGTAQITASGTATLKLRPGPGSHSYKAVFAGTNAFAGSSSAAAALTVTGAIPALATSATINQTGTWGAYTLTATVSEVGNTAPPTGTVSFLDTNHSNAVLGTGALGSPSSDVAWSAVNTSAPSLASVTYAVADLNGDGIPDLFIKDYFGAYNVFLGNGDGTFTQKGAAFGPNSQTGSFVLGDFNNDGIPDVAAIDGVLYAANNSVTIFLGNGDGTFTVAGSSPAIGYNPAAIAAADMNGDGNADLIVEQQESSTSPNGEVVIFWGNGDGTFTQTPSTTTLASVGKSILPADLNGDGTMDLVLPAVGNSGSFILLGNGDGSFNVSAGPAQAAAPSAAVADVNHDGIPDLVFATASPYSLAVFLGNGDGTFTAAPASPDLSTGNTIAITDLNQDGIPDVIYSNGSKTGVVFGKGDGTFVPSAASLSFSTYNFDTPFVVADFNGDGWPDVLSIDGSARTINDALTHPAVTATASTTVSIPAAGQHLADASYEGDSNYNPSASGTVSLWGAPPASATALTVTAAGTAVTSVAAGTKVTLTATVTAGGSPVAAGQVNFCDASGASCSDIHLLGTAALSSSGTAVFNFVPGPGQHSYKAVFVQSGAGLASQSNIVSLTVGAASAPVYTDAISIAAAGNPGNYTLTATVKGFGGTAPPTGNVSFVDTSAANSVLATAALGSAASGNGWLISQTPTFTGARPEYEVAADFNQDGIPDLAVLSINSNYGTTYSITIFTGKGDGTFGAGTLLPTTITSEIVPKMITGDFNGDGKTDLVVLIADSSYGSGVTVLPGNGDGTFGSPQTSKACTLPNNGGDVYAGTMAAADFNGDGKLDLAVAGNCVNACGVTIILGNGDGTFGTGTTLAPTRSFGLVATGDFNGDGVPDLVLTNYFEDGGSPTIFLGKGDGTFTSSAAAVTLAYFPTSIVVGDFNGDGVQDLAFSDLYGVEIALGSGDGTFTETTASPIAVPSELDNLQTGDFNRDGKVDLVGLDNYNDRIVLLIGAGDGAFTVTATDPSIGQYMLAPFAIVAADFNSDGMPDLALLTNNVSTASILLGTPTETATATVTGIAPASAGTHDVEASYAGDSHFAAAVSATTPLLAGMQPVVISPAPGTYTSVQTITLSESVPGATIYYMAYGAFSTAGFVQYTGPITLSSAGVTYIQAYATETGYQNSGYLTAVYTLNLPSTATPAISLASGYYATEQTVTITDATAGAQIYYTTNGTVPTSSSTLYTGPITVSSSQTLFARAVAYGYDFSPVATAQYLIGSSPASLIYTIAGTGATGYLGDGGPAIAAELNTPASVVRDASGNLYVSDYLNHMVRKIAAADGTISRIAGTGTIGYSGDGGAATSAELMYPKGLALDSAGNLLIADVGNSTIRRLNLTSGIIATYAGNPNGTTAGDGGQATDTRLGSLGGIAVDSFGNLFISQAPGSIRKVDNSSGVITTVAGTGTAGFSGDGGPAISATLYSPAGLAFDASGNLYVADTISDVIRELSAVNGQVTANSIISTVAGVAPPSSGYGQGGYSGDGGPAINAALNEPVAVAVDPSGNLYISDMYNGAIRKVAAGTGIISTVAGNGLYCASIVGDGGPSASASLCLPGGIAVDAAGNIYIADQYSNRVREAFAPALPPSTQAAAPTFSVQGGTYSSPQTVTISGATPGSAIYVTVDGTAPTPATAPRYSTPITIAGTVTVKAVAAAPGYLTSSAASATYTVTSFSPVITTVAGTGKPVHGISGSGGPALNVGFEMPRGVAVDTAGNLYVADSTNDVVWSIAAGTGNASVYAGNGVPGSQGDGGPAVSALLNQPQGMAFDSAGNLFIADSSNNEIRRVDAVTGVISTVAGSVNYTAASGDGGPATSARLLGPTAIAFDSADNLYIADTGDCTIRKVAAKTGIITTVAGNGTYAFSGDGGPATSAAIMEPSFLAVDKAANIYLGTMSNGRVRKVDAATGIITTIAGVGDIVGNLGDGGPAIDAQISPQSIAVDAAGNLYLSSWPAVVREVDAKTGVITRVAGIGFAGFSGDGGAALDAEFYGPTTMAFNASGDLYIADSYNYRVRKVMFAPELAATPVFSIPSGTYAAAQSVAITTATPGASIYYTTDGTTPTTSSTLYSEPILVTATTTIKAIATAAGYSPSAVASAAYVISVPAQTPSLTSLSPAIANAGGSALQLTVNGAGFTAGSVVYWGASALTTQYSSSAQLIAQVPASNIAAAGIASITVQAPSPCGGTSNALSFEIDTAGAGTPVFSPASVTVSAGQSASYSVTLPSSATSVSVKCLNLPSGASCSYSASAHSVTITTTSATPAGTYVVTVVFTETLPITAAFILLPLLLLPWGSGRKRKGARLWLVASVGLLFAVLAAGMGCGGGGSSGGGSTPQTHQVTSSGTVTLIVQ